MNTSLSREVLIVEDEWLVRMELTDAFDALGFAITECGTAEEAIEILHGRRAFDLLVTDIRLAGVKDGWEVAREARDVNAHIPVIYLSANPPAPDLIVEGGIFIDKPALMERVTAVAMQLLEDAG